MICLSFDAQPVRDGSTGVAGRNAKMCGGQFVVCYLGVILGHMDALFGLFVVLLAGAIVIGMAMSVERFALDSS